MIRYNLNKNDLARRSELKRLDNILVKLISNEMGLKKEDIAEFFYDTKTRRDNIISEYNEFIVRDMFVCMYKFAMEPILKEKRRIAHNKASSKYRKDKLGMNPRDPDFVPLTKAQQNKRYAETEKGKVAIRKAKEKYYTKKVKRKRQAVKSRWC
jgi:hypothetical protein